MENKKPYNTKVTRFYRSAKGDETGPYYIEIKPDDFDELQKVIDQFEVGGKLWFKILKPESRKQDTSPYAYLEYETKAQVEIGKKEWAANKPKGKFPQNQVRTQSRNTSWE